MRRSCICLLSLFISICLMTMRITTAASYKKGTYTASKKTYLYAKKKTSSKKLSTIKKGTSVNVTSISGKWGKAKISSQSGYVYLPSFTYNKVSSSSSTTKTSSSSYKAGVYLTKASIPVRSGPGKTYKKIGSIAKGKKVTVETIKKEKWALYKIGTKTGYFSLLNTSYVAKKAESTSTKSTQTSSKSSSKASTSTQTSSKTSSQSSSDISTSSQETPSSEVTLPPVDPALANQCFKDKSWQVSHMGLHATGMTKKDDANTLNAFEGAIARGYKMIECDVKLIDEVYVCQHTNMNGSCVFSDYLALFTSGSGLKARPLLDLGNPSKAKINDICALIISAEEAANLSYGHLLKRTTWQVTTKTALTNIRSIYKSLGITEKARVWRLYNYGSPSVWKTDTEAKIKEIIAAGFTGMNVPALLEYNAPYMTALKNGDYGKNGKSLEFCVHVVNTSSAAYSFKQLGADYIMTEK